MTSSRNNNNNNNNNSNETIIVIEPGLVLLRNFVPDTTCQHFAQMAMEFGEQGENGFYTQSPSGQRVLNTGECRGRIYDTIRRFPPTLLQQCNAAVHAACTIDEAMPRMNCTHLLLNMYTDSQGLVWHRDIYENDGKSDHPVVNMCIGASCVFGFQHEDHDPERTLILRSGDILLLGGSCRFMKHAVLN